MVITLIHAYIHLFLTWGLAEVRLPDAALGVVRPLLPGCPAKKRLPWPELMEEMKCPSEYSTGAFGGHMKYDMNLYLYTIATYIINIYNYHIFYLNMTVYDIDIHALNIYDLGAS